MISRSFVFAGEGVDKKYLITGKVKGISTGKLFLVTYESEKPDTLGWAEIKDENFEFVGSVNDVTPAYFCIVGREEMIPVMLENTEIRVDIDEMNLNIEGGKAQQLYNEFNAIGADIAEQQIRVQKDYEEALKSGNKRKSVALQEQFEMLTMQLREQELKLIQETADHVRTAYVIVLSMERDSPELLKEKYTLLGEHAKGSVYGREIAKRVAKYDQVAIGQVAPDFTMMTPEGNSFTLHGITGKLKILSFWASWDMSCRQENVNLIRIYQKYRPKGVEIVSISLDTNKEAWKKAIGEDAMIWANGSDLKGPTSDITRLYWVKKIPHVLLLDENNVIIAKDLYGNVLWDKLSDFFKKK